MGVPGSLASDLLWRGPECLESVLYIDTCWVLPSVWNPMSPIHSLVNIDWLLPRVGFSGLDLFDLVKLALVGVFALCSSP